MANEIEKVTSQRVIDMVDVDGLEQVMLRINAFQKIIQKTLKQNLDFGIIPGTSKPTLLKPGAEKILMLLGLRSEFEIMTETRDLEMPFFRYQIKCKLFKGDTLITEGMGACNTKEKKYLYSDAFSMDNTVLKMAKKRSLVDSALMVGSLSDLFTQDIEDMDLNNGKIDDKKPKVYTDQDGVITTKQAKRMFAISGGDNNLVAETMKKYGYEVSTNVKKLDYENICKEIEENKNKKNEPKENK